MNLRVKVVKDLETTMEKLNGWGLPVVLISPTGQTQELKKDSEDALTGQVLYSHKEWKPDTGEDIVVDEPVVTLRLESLEIEPKPGENWAVKIPETPDPNAVLITFVINKDKAIEFNRGLGIVKLYLSKAKQS